MHMAGFKPPDEKWRKMSAVYAACLAAGLDIPKEVDDFFEGGTPDTAGVTVDLDDHESVREYKEDLAEGYEIDLDKFPKDIRVLRFFIWH